MKKFKCAAIRYKTDDGKFVELRGERHHEIVEVIRHFYFGEFDAYKRTHIDGFIYGEEWTATFVTREEATEIAKEMGIKMRGCELTSEDLW